MANDSGSRTLEADAASLLACFKRAWRISRSASRAYGAGSLSRPFSSSVKEDPRGVFTQLRSKAGSSDRMTPFGQVSVEARRRD
jgi:hypothetical protein